MAKRVFLSHAYADKKFVEKTIPLFTTALGLVANDIFCSSIEGHGVSKGKNFVDSIRGEVVQADVIIALISPAYLESAFCMAELGAAWALNSVRFPIIVPPLDFKVMDATLLGIVGVSIDNEEAMTQLFEEARNSLETTVSGIVASRAVRNFIDDWKSMLSQYISRASKVDASTHENVRAQLNKAMDERNDAERELKLSGERIEALSKAERFEDVEKINRSYDGTDWEKEFQELIYNVKKMKAELGGAEVCRQLILDHIGIEKPIDDSNERYQFDRAHELGIYDYANRKWNYQAEEVVELFRHLEKAIDYLNENPSVVKTLKDRGEKSDPNTIKFWEEHVHL